jgi:enoyl-CoA hydratase/carnithine racemase
MADLIRAATADHVCTITLDRPDKRNALTATMIGTLRAKLHEAEENPSVRVIVLAATGAAFCAGLDLREMQKQREAGEADLGPLEVVLEEVEACPLPTIAAVQGDALAGGCELALHCDLVVASEQARFGMPLARIGLAVPVTLTWKLIDTIGAGKTKEMLFTAEPVGAPEALAIGLVNRVVAAGDLDAAVRKIAGTIAHNAPLAVRAMKAFVQRGIDRTTTRRDDLEALARQVRSSDDLKEGLVAQLGRRTPVFQGR